MIAFWIKATTQFGWGSNNNIQNTVDISLCKQMPCHTYLLKTFAPLLFNGSQMELTDIAYLSACCSV